MSYERECDIVAGQSKVGATESRRRIAWSVIRASRPGGECASAEQPVSRQPPGRQALVGVWCQRRARREHGGAHRPRPGARSGPRAAPAADPRALTGLPSGGHGAKPCPVTGTVRVPAWRIIAGEPEQRGPAARSAAGQTPHHVRHVLEAPRPQPLRRPAHSLARQERTVRAVTQPCGTDNHLPQRDADPPPRIRLFR